MRKVMVWIKVLLYLLPIWITGRKVRKESEEVRFETARQWCYIVLKAAGAKVKVEGIEKIPGGQTLYYVANHQGSLDPFIFIYGAPTYTTLVSKVENTKIPFLSGWMKTLEAISFDREDLRDSIRMIKDVTARLKDGKNVIIFPEGTRSKGKAMNEFKAGSLKPALSAKVTIVPVAMKNTYLIDVGGPAREDMKMIFCDPLPYEEYKDLNTQQLAEKIQGIIQAQLDA